MALREREVPGDIGKMSGFQRWRKRIDEKKPAHRGFAGLSDTAMWCYDGVYLTLSLLVTFLWL